MVKSNGSYKTKYLSGHSQSPCCNMTQSGHFPAAKQRFKGTLTRHNILEPTKLSISTFYKMGQSRLEIILRYQCPFTVMVP